MRKAATMRTLFVLVFAVTLTASAPIAAAYTVVQLSEDLHFPIDAEVVPGFEDKIFISQLGGTSADTTDGNPITQAEGRIVIYDRNTGQVDYNNPFLVINDTSLTDFSGVPEVGLFSTAFHPDFQNNGKFYVNVAVEHDGPAPTVDTRTSPFKTVVREYTADINNPALPIVSSRAILELDQPAINHNGSWIGFNPIETVMGNNYLYITQGDGGDQHDPAGYGQDPSSWFGTVMRIDLDGDDYPADVARNYAVPSDNPFIGGGGAPEVWTYGLRNPWRASFDPSNGDFYIGDVGQGWYEEIDVVSGGSGGGQNFGWRLREGFHATPTGGVGGPPPANNVDPLYEYLHIGRPGADPDFDGNSVTGGVLYRGPIPELQGRYFFADNVSGHIWSFNPADPQNTVQLMDDLFQPDQGQIFAVTSFDLDEQGNLLIVDGAGALYQVIPSTEFTLQIDRDTGSMTFLNQTGSAIDIRGYEITSPFGAIDPLSLTPITDNFDAPPPGDGSVDPANAWEITSAVGDSFSFSEQTTGAAATIADGAGFTLSAGDGWIGYINEDLQLSLTLGDGSQISGEVSFIGNDGNQFQRSDLNFDGEITVGDWVVFLSGNATNLAGMSAAQRYGLGDLDNDGDNDVDDFRLFKSDFNAANGAGAFEAAVARVPEPATISAFAMMLVIVGFRSRLR